jgi:4-phosphopantoate--beta-alanine ligase
MGKSVIAIDLNLFSRTAKCAHVTIVDNVTRAIPNIAKFAEEFKDLIL